MTGFLTFILAGLAAVLLPLASFSVWALIFSKVLPGSKDIIRRILRLDRKDPWRREMSLSVSQLLFYVSADRFSSR